MQRAPSNEKKKISFADFDTEAIPLTIPATTKNAKPPASILSRQNSG